MASNRGKPIQTRAQTAARPVYEDFKPKYEWKQEDEAVVLLIHLPGFTKENVRVTTQDGKILRASGERLVVGNKKHGFKEDFPIPEYCSVKGISGKLEQGILSIKMPKKSISQVEPKGNGDKIAAPETPTPHQDATTNAQTTDGRGDRDSDSFKASQKLQDPKPSDPISSNTNKVSTNTDTKEQKKQEDEDESGAAKILAALTYSGAEKENDNDADERSERKSKKPAAGLLEEAENDKKVFEASFTKQFFDEDIKTQVVNNRKERETKTKAIDEHGTKEKRDEKKEEAHVWAGFAPKMEEHKLPEEKGFVWSALDTQDRQLMVNMGVAFLVIVALGAYFSYTYASSSGKAQN